MLSVANKPYMLSVIMLNVIRISVMVATKCLAERAKFNRHYYIWLQNAMVDIIMTVSLGHKYIRP
jgi:hypothetical protein